MTTTMVGSNAVEARGAPLAGTPAQKKEQVDVLMMREIVRADIDNASRVQYGCTAQYSRVQLICFEGQRELGLLGGRPSVSS